MKAIVRTNYGLADVLRLEEIEKPTPGDSEVLIKVRAASVNPYDWHLMRGTPRFVRLFTGLRKPKSPRVGADVAGEIEAVGRSVTRLRQAMRCSVPAAARLPNTHVHPSRRSP